MTIQSFRSLRAVILLVAATCPLLWFLTQNTDDVPGEDVLGIWFLIATPFCLEAGIRMERSRLMALAGASVVVAYLSRAASLVLGAYRGGTDIALARLSIAVVSWTLLSIFAGLIFYWSAQMVVSNCDEKNSKG